MERHLQDNVAKSGLAQVVDRDVQRDCAAAAEGRRGVQDRQQGHQLHSRRGEFMLYIIPASCQVKLLSMMIFLPMLK